MAEHSSLALLAILRRHGVTQELLELWVHILQSRTPGSVTFHHDHGGAVAKLDVHLAHKVQHPGIENRLTKVLATAMLVADCQSAPPD